MVWYGMVWYGMVWYGMVWYSIVNNYSTRARWIWDSKEFTIRKFCDAVTKGSPLRMRLWCRDSVGWRRGGKICFFEGVVENGGFRQSLFKKVSVCEILLPFVSQTLFLIRVDFILCCKHKCTFDVVFTAYPARKIMLE